ncbi:hypothetical protein ACXYN8_10795 [Altererythrobacter sp. CAU 1778]
MNLFPAIRLIPAAALAATLVACVPSSQEPAPEPTPAPTPAPQAAPAPPPPPRNWIDAPQTPGDWSYRVNGAATEAVFTGSSGQAEFALRCVTGSGRVEILRRASATQAVPLAVRTETASRALTGAPIAGQPFVTTSLGARDSLLDAIAFSRGRFAFETQGAPTLYLPSWVEISRVIEDCR